MKKGYQIVAAVLCIMLIASGCGVEHKTEVTVERVEQKKVQIGLSFASFLIERWEKDRDIFVSNAQKAGAEVNVQQANGSLKEQIAQIDYFIKKGVDVIVIIAVDSYGLSDAVSRAKAAGIPVIAYDRLICDADIDLFVSFDSEEVGRLMAESIVENIRKDGDIIVINGDSADNNAELLAKGYEEVFQNTDINIRKSTNAEGWIEEIGFDVTNEYLDGGAVPDAVLCGNDGIAGQTVKALSEQRLAGKVCVVGQDADLAACQRVVEGTQEMTVYKPIGELAERAAALAVALAKGERVEEGFSIFNGRKEVPYKKLPPVAVTAENMDEVITGKYHQKSEIYMNIKNILNLRNFLLPVLW